MDPQNVGIIIFLVGLAALLYWKRKRVTLQPIVFITARGQMFWVSAGVLLIVLGLFAGVKWGSAISFADGDKPSLTVKSVFGNVMLVIGAILLVFAVIKREWVTKERKIPLIYAIFYRTKKGIALMDTIAKRWPRFVNWFGKVSIWVGFMGMVVIAFALIDNVVKLIMHPEAAPGVGVVLPVQVKGAFFVPFFYWVGSIFIIAVIHEFWHGIMARRHGIKVKSGGFLFLSLIVPIIPAAFVEPDEKTLKKKSTSKQIAVFSAGPFSNIVLAAICLGALLLVANPITDSILIENGVKVTGLIEEESPAGIAGIEKEIIITHIGETPVSSVGNFSHELKGYQPGNLVMVKTDQGVYEVTLGSNPENESLAYMGVFVAQSTVTRPDVIAKYGEFLPKLPLWFVTLLYWLWVLNFGIGLFNLVPLGPIDGGRMLDAALKHNVSSEKARSIFKVVSMITLSLILINVGFAFFG